MPSRRVLIVGTLLFVISLGAGVWWFMQREHEVLFVVPPGATASLQAGEALEILPATIVLQKNDTLIIRNDDSVAVQIGPFPIEPGQRFIRRYMNKGTFDLLCSVHQGEKLRVIVE